MPTNRTPRHYQSRTRISVEAIDLFERGVRLQRRRETQAVYDELNRISVELGRTLGLRPWVPCPLLNCDAEKPPDYTTGELAIANWYKSRGIRLELEAAIRARAERARQVKTGSSSPPQSPPIAAAPREH